VKRTHYEAPHYAVFFSLLLLPPFYFQIFSSASCSLNTRTLFFSLSMTGQVSNPYKTTGKIIVSYIV